MVHSHILLVDDTTALAEMYALALTHEGFSVSLAQSGAELFSFLDANSIPPDLLVLDLKLPDMDGRDILKDLKQRGFNAPVIVITGNGSIHTAIETMRLGAADFLVKPFPVDRLIESAMRAMKEAGLATKADINIKTENYLSQNVPEENVATHPNLRSGFGGFIGISEPMQIVYNIIESAAKSNATVFITGESGTGKEVCAEAIHKYSSRNKAPFIAINCAAIPRDLLESELFGHVKGAFTGATNDREGAVALAKGGTLFLDEIAEMESDMQTKLLRFLQNHTYRKVGGNKPEKANVRIVCATNRDPMEEIKSGNLRQDLYYRLHVIPIEMPALRRRKNDIVDLADYFLKQYAREERKSFRSFSPEAEIALIAYSWPGNVRELQNIVRGVVVLNEGRVASLSMLPAHIKRISALETMPVLIPQTDVTPLWRIEKSAIENAIMMCEGNIPRAAALLEISPSTIYRKKMTWDKHGGSFLDDNLYF